jgi:hypothetical protein
MPYRVAETALNASSIDITNVIRENAGLEYQNQVPVVETLEDLPRVGEVIVGHPAFANYFINALINMVARVDIRSALFNNPYASLKKGYLDYGETVEEVFVGMAKAREFNVEKAEAREFKRTLPDVKTAFHTMNYRAQYPITIQYEDLRMAFNSQNGVNGLVDKIKNSVYTGAEYDEFLLFKYVIIKAVANGKMHPVSVGDGTDLKDAAVAFRSISNLLPFVSNKYNAFGVHTVTSKADQHIFMDARFDAEFDVNVLADAFNMDKTDIKGKVHLIDDWTTFDNDRFTQIIENTNSMDLVTDEELALMANVKAILVDEEWFQFYDNLFMMTDKQVSSGLYWNYFLNVWKTLSVSPFSNAVVFVSDDATITAPNTFTVTVAGKDTSALGTILTLSIADMDTLANTNYQFIGTEESVTEGIAVQEYGVVIIPTDNTNTITLKMKVGDDTYTGGTAVGASTAQGATITMTKDE